MDIWVKRPRLTKLRNRTQVVCVARYSAQVEVTVVQVILEKYFMGIS